MFGKEILYSEMSPGNDWEDAFNSWYDSVHIPVRMDVDGFICARRYVALDSDQRGQKRYLVIYELTSSDVLESPAYTAIKNNPSDQTRWMLKSVSGFTRYSASLISDQAQLDTHQHSVTPYIYTVFFKVPVIRQSEFNDWYEQDHVPILLRNPHWIRCRRFAVDSGSPGSWTHIAVHYISDLSALDSLERQIARNTEWRNRLSSEEWFKGEYTVFRLYSETATGERG